MPAARSRKVPRPNGDGRRNRCAGTVDAIRKRGDAGNFLLLPDASHKGNSHMPMMDRNNLQIADLISGWLGESTATR